MDNGFLTKNDTPNHHHLAEQAAIRFEQWYFHIGNLVVLSLSYSFRQKQENKRPQEAWVNNKKIYYEKFLII